MRIRAQRGLFLSLLALAVLGAGAGAFVAVQSAAQPAKPDLTLQISPASQSITRGQAATYTVSVTPAGGFTGTVALGASGLPSATTAAFAPNQVTISGPGTVTSNLTVTTTSSTPLGSFTPTVTGTSGKVSGSVSLGLTVNAPITSSLALATTPGAVTLNPGASAVYSLALTRANVAGPVTLSLATQLPSGASAAFAPNPVTGSSSTLQVDTKPSTPAGTYALNLVATGTGASSGQVYAYASVSLVVSTKGKDFGISGNLPGTLAPGVSKPLDLMLTNPNNQSLAIGNLTVTVQGVTKAPGAPTGQCTAADYAVVQYSGPYPLSIPANGSAKLSALVADSAKWPQVRMVNAATNQDGCKGATVTLAYSGSGSGA